MGPARKHPGMLYSLVLMMQASNFDTSTDVCSAPPEAWVIADVTGETSCLVLVSSSVTYRIGDGGTGKGPQ